MNCRRVNERRARTKAAARRGHWAGWVALFCGVVTAVAACGDAESDGGSGGRPGTGGASGGSGGAHAATGGSLSGGRPSSGGMPGSTGGAGSGGNEGGMGGLSGGAGAGGAGGQGGWPGIDPACHCVYDGFFSMECTMPIELFATRVEVPSSCEGDFDFVRRGSCDDGTTGYSWLEGSENDYRLTRDEQGRPLYGSAFGYVGGLCQDERAPIDVDIWYIVAGMEPASSSCESCTVCTTWAAGGAGGSSPVCP